MSFEKHRYLHNHHHDQDAKHFFHPNGSLRNLAAFLTPEVVFLIGWLDLHYFMKSVAVIDTATEMSVHSVTMYLFLAMQFLLNNSGIRGTKDLQEERQDGRLIFPTNLL